jgi:murein tripeptide amidase MpaA
MLNPDGVFMGNYRTGVLGDDFNRKFATGKK